ncbi:hypothetical protein PMG71_01410 [Roseofilum sp. BLCC_M154]|uniref:Lipid/polyisoprenoid-binding YceI-like domain-containing protein n=1 Tax=Roseofilum acuticapitatum BLCC-M154 TaxID=3022444 RepID=A0ABT7AMH5_9CYAN|nr:hypothetical protein [Roseofilum acuticapitatum]MDJ1168080.1 hypothetical protein [Roseofilum acuticapitatum BLCC-M154]
MYSSISASSSLYSEQSFQPIPAPSEPLQYRAIGLIRGRYYAGDHLTQGTLVASDGTEIDAVLLGRMMSLLKKHLDLDVEHLWVVYPRTREKEENLHMQIVGVWEPETLDSPQLADQSLHPLMGDNYFSIRGEVIFHSSETGVVKVKINQAPRKKGEKPRSFKLTLKGTLMGKALHHFWEFHVVREGSDLVIQEALCIAPVPRDPRSRSPRSMSRPRRSGHFKPRSVGTPKPILSSSGSPRPQIQKNIHRKPTPEG